VEATKFVLIEGLRDKKAEIEPAPPMLEALRQVRAHLLADAPAAEPAEERANAAAAA
jgi:hypothetical protein